MSFRFHKQCTYEMKAMAVFVAGLVQEGIVFSAENHNNYFEVILTGGY